MDTSKRNLFGAEGWIFRFRCSNFSVVCILFTSPSLIIKKSLPFPQLRRSWPTTPWPHVLNGTATDARKVDSEKCWAFHEMLCLPQKSPVCRGRTVGSNYSTI